MKWKNGFTSQGDEQHSHLLVGMDDMFATLSNLTGINIPSGQAIDSVNFANYILNETSKENLWEYLGP